MRTWFAGLLLVPPLALAQLPQVVPVRPLTQAPTVDGKLAEWGNEGWTRTRVIPALDEAERARFGFGPADDQTGSLIVEIKASVVGGRFYVALRYPDDAADIQPRMWRWQGDKYVESKQREDMLALRFHIDGNFDRTMLTTKESTTDVWLWSAARTNAAGIAHDLNHRFSGNPLDDAAEYTSPDGQTFYIKKQRDAGKPPYRALPRPNEFKGDKQPAIEPSAPSGSAADVVAKGEWQSGQWRIEFGRNLNTGNADDAVFKPGQRILGQIAVFNRGHSENKSVSEPLLFDFSAIK